MDAAEFLALTDELVDAIAEATAHDLCDAPCLLCGDLETPDPFTLMQGLERALGSFLVDNEARSSDAGAAVDALFARLRAADLRYGGHGVDFYGITDPRIAQRVFVYLKAAALDVALGCGWPRIEN